MGFFSSIGSAFSSTFSTCCSAVSSTLGSVGGFAARCIPVIGPIITAIDVLVKVATVVSTVLQALGVFRPDEKIEDIGDRALQAAEKGITSDKFEKYDDYMKEIRGFELDPKKSESYTPEVKIMAGMSVGIKGTEEKMKLSEGSLDKFVAVLAKDAKDGDFFTPERTAAIASAVMATTISKDIPTIAAYFSGKLPPQESAAVTKELASFEHQRSPEKSDRDIFTELKQARDVQQDRKE